MSSNEVMYKIQLWVKDTDPAIAHPIETFGNVASWKIVGDSRLALTFDHGGADIVPIDKIGYIKIRNQK